MKGLSDVVDADDADDADGDDDVVDYDDIDSDDLLYSCATLLFSNIIAMQVWKYHHGIIDLSQHVIA